MKIKILGAGMAGLLAANMLARFKPLVIEGQPELPNNHSAVLRFATTKVADVLGIPFRPVRMIKTYLPWRNRVADALAYSRKCTGFFRSDRSIASDVFNAERFIAPSDLIARMAGDVNTEFGKYFNCSSLMGNQERAPIISTLPMPVLMKQLSYPHLPEFRHVYGANMRARLRNCDAYLSLYVPDPRYHFNRISITGDQLIVEYAFPTTADEEWFNLNVSGRSPGVNVEEMSAISELIGIELDQWSDVSVKRQQYAKIQPIDERVRKQFLAWATDHYNIFSLGRYATWRPRLMLDDLPNDIMLIQKWIGEGRYDLRAAR